MSKRNRNNYNNQSMSNEPDQQEEDDTMSLESENENTVQEPVATSEPSAQESTATPVETAISKAEMATVTVSREPLTKFEKLANEYISLASKGLSSVESRKKAISVLTELAMFVLRSRDTRVFDACMAFMLQNRAIMLSPQTVMRDMVPYGDKSKFTRVVQFYVMFQSLVESKLMKTRYTLNITTIRTMFKNDHLANWLLAHK